MLCLGQWGECRATLLCLRCIKAVFPLWPSRDCSWRQVTAAGDSSCPATDGEARGTEDAPYCANPWDSLTRIPKAVSLGQKARGQGLSCHPMQSEDEDMGEKWNKWETIHQELLASLLGWSCHHPLLTLSRTRGHSCRLFAPLPVLDTHRNSTSIHFHCYPKHKYQQCIILILHIHVSHRGRFPSCPGGGHCIHTRRRILQRSHGYLFQCAPIPIKKLGWFSQRSCSGSQGNSYILLKSSSQPI